MATKRKTRNAKGDKPLKQKKKKAHRPPRSKAAKATTKTAAPPTPSQVPLNSPIDVRREQAKVYREARGGAIDSNKAGKLVWMLGEIRRTIETEDLETKLREIEKAAAAQGITK